MARGALGAFAVKIAGAAILFGLHILLARLLSITGYGIYVYSMAWVNILVLVCLMGFQTSLVRFIAAYRAQQKWGLLRGLCRYSNLFVFVCSAATAIIGLIFVFFSTDRISPEQAQTFYLAFLLLPVFSLVKLREADLQALKHVVQSQLLLRVLRPLILAALVVGLFLFFQGQIKASTVMTANLAAVLVVFGIGSFWLHKSLPEDIRDCQAVYSRREWLKVSLPLSLIVGLSLVLKRIDIIMIGAMRGSEDAGIYSPAAHVSSLLVFGLMAVNAILAPMVSELYYTGRRKQLQRVVALAARGIFAFTVLAGFLLIIFGKYCLGFFGKDYIAGYVPLLILLGGRIVSSLTGSVAILMTMTGHQNQAGAIIGTNAVLNIILNALLIPRLGLRGAAISTAFSLALCNVLMLVYVWRKLRINPTIVKVLGEEEPLGEKAI